MSDATQQTIDLVLAPNRKVHQVLAAVVRNRLNAGLARNGDERAPGDMSLYRVFGRGVMSDVRRLSARDAMTRAKDLERGD